MGKRAEMISAIGLGLVVAASGSLAALARPMGGGGFGGPGSGAGVRPGAGWGASSVAWGVGSLATAAAITSAVDAAAYQQSTVIVVPQTSLQLDYGSIQALPPSGVQFAYGVAGMPLMTATSDCKLGLINGMAPTTADQAQVLNASCHIAYGSN